jgi:hypothetical protein
MLLGFKPQFEEKILAKEKRHTIRAKRKRRPIRAGDRLDCYVNSRQKSMRLLGRWLCTKVQDIEIAGAHGYFVTIDGATLDRDELENLARADGFENFRDMSAFWIGRLPFHGDMIHWDPEQPQPGPRRKGKRK